MLTIRLQRVGRKNDPSFRVVVVDSKRAPKSGNYLEMVGSHNPKMDATELKGERIKHWIGKGATVSGTVHNLLISHHVIEGKKINVLPKKRPIVKEEEKAQQAESKEAPVQEETAADLSPEEVPREEEPKQVAEGDEKQIESSNKS